LKRGEEAEITFLDGDLMSDGQLNMTSYYQHSVKVDGRWTDFVCTQHEDTSQACPICEGDSYPAMVGVFSVIDHRNYTNKQGNNVQDQVRLFVAKKHTLAQLQKIAVKRGGLAGARFDISRTDGEKTPNVGDLIDFSNKKPVKKILAKYKAEVVEYEKAIHYYTPEELREQGFGVVQEGGTRESTGAKPKKKQKKKKKKTKKTTIKNKKGSSKDPNYYDD
jgi:hypothetical protein